MPIKSVKQTVADAINNLSMLLRREYGKDYSFSINGNGFVLAQSNINGVVHPTPSVDTSAPKDISYTNVTTAAGNTLHVFYNPENSLVVIDLVSANEQGGIELLRQTLNEKKLLKHTK